MNELLHTLLRVASLDFQVVHAACEEDSNLWPAHFENKDQNRDRDRPNDQDCLQADSSLFVTMNAPQQVTKGSGLTHRGLRGENYMNGQVITRLNQANEA